jgi:hypothetical protein
VVSAVSEERLKAAHLTSMARPWRKDEVLFEWAEEKMTPRMKRTEGLSLWIEA